MVSQLDEMIKLINAGNLQEAKKQFCEKASSLSKYDYFKLSKHLSEREYHLESMSVLKKGLEYFPKNEYLIRSLVPKVYKHIIRRFYNEKHIPEEQYTATIEYIDRILEEMNRGEYSYIYLRHVDYLLTKQNVNKEIVLAYLQRLKGFPLSKDAYKNGEQSFPSPYEKWVTKTAKLQFELKQYTRCIETVNEALKAPISWHYHNDIWLLRLKARSLCFLGEITDAVRIYEELLLKHPTWFMYREMAECYENIGERQKALYYGAKACLSRDAEPMKCGKLYTMMYEWLVESEEYMAFVHIDYIIQVYKENDFHVDEKTKKLHERICQKYEQPKNIRQTLERFWFHIIERIIPRHEGTICKLLPNGKTGFIEYGNKQKIYFKKSDVRFPKKLVQEGKKVTFFIEESFDFAKNRRSQIAQYICEVNDEEHCPKSIPMSK
ncbi:tetratricopeptide (TPR) repeat protein [Anoxybacillus tengchongensis]|uniref:Tetratricopeptide (TPR) repeat protein n=1 Tax=Anoxybacillus tengchongensis TaxID=576944 RepID=A0A7W9YPC0_9BACL|nr:hypothetical protein [Anoxybacillus tengchongensis]MBB6175201.1 tetratricopeptide (TPR) repeat protein [Anoxybacillus tengchongensis]